MNDSIQISRFVEAYQGQVPKQRIEDVYRRWVGLRRAELGSINHNVAAEILDSLCKEKAAVIREATKADRPLLLAVDELWADVGEISRDAERWARHISSGKPLDDADKTKATADRERLEMLRKRLSEIPKVLRSPLEEVFSETTLDLHYSLNAGHGPKSLRLGRFEGAK